MRLISPVLLFGFAAILCGCGSGPTQLQPPPREQPTTLAIVGGDGQNAAVAQQLPGDLAVRVADGNGAPLAGVQIHWSVAPGSGFVLPATSTTGSDGVAHASWTLGTTAGMQQATAAAGTLTTTFAATAQPGPAASLQITGPSMLLTDEVITLDAIALDLFGNPTGDPVAFNLWVTDWHVLRVDNPGHTVTGLYPGTRTIHAESGTLTGERIETVNPRISFSFGPEEVVFRYTTDSCATYDLPDQPTRMIRMSDGSLMMIDGDEPDYYASYGPDFNSLRRSCSAIFHADHDLTAETYNNLEWIWAPYRIGGNIYAIVHNEYHDPFAGNCWLGNPTAGNPCWYNSLTFATSTDGGQSFSHPAAPTHVLAPPPWTWDSAHSQHVYGYFASSNIIHSSDGYYYAAFRSISPEPVTTSLCMMRTQDLSDQTSWRAWDGFGFNLLMSSPYLGPAPAACQNLMSENEVFVNDNLTYNTYLNEYLMVGASVLWGPNPTGCGITFQTSPDLIHWTRQQLMLPGHLIWSPCNLGPPMMLYGAVIDHGDNTENFETSGQSFSLYYTRFNDPYLNRDLVRVPVIMTRH